MSRVKAPASLNLPELVKTTFARARSSEELHYFPTQVTVLPVRIPNSSTNIPFQLRFAPALANKPKAPPPDPSEPSKPHKAIDPFANPPPSLFLTDIGSSHFLVLNKFAVVPEHFILATKAFERQTHVLHQADLEATLACIEAYEPSDGSKSTQGLGGDGLFAFFNSGDFSGASQPHRHIQLLPVSRMKDGLESESQWDVLAGNLSTKKAPFVTFSEKISLDISGSDLYAAYLRLYRLACRAVSFHRGSGPPHSDAPAEGESQISYNMAMTKNSLVICPRLAEGAKLTSQDGHVLGELTLNGTLLAGTALVKSELEWAALKRDPDGLLGVLGGIGVPSKDFKESGLEG